MLSTDLPYAPAFLLIDNHTRKKILYIKAFTQMFIAITLLNKKNLNGSTNKEIKCEILLVNERKVITPHNIDGNCTILTKRKKIQI